jgi:sensor c-di-GMP phosphodiesterase-like protein
MAAKLGRGLVAEGVETIKQGEVLIAIGVSRLKVFP